jgi:hypothetical protein
LGTAGDNQSTISYSRCPAGKSLGLGDPSIPTSDKRIQTQAGIHSGGGFDGFMLRSFALYLLLSSKAFVSATRTILPYVGSRGVGRGVIQSVSVVFKKLKMGTQ